MGQEIILNEIGTQCTDLASRIERLVGADLGIMSAVVSAVRRRADELDDPVKAIGAARAIMGALYPYEAPPKEWWSTVTGYACARAIGYHREVAPFQQAAWVLNVSRQRIYQLCAAERLIRTDTPRDGVTPRSLRYELMKHGRRPTR